MSTILEKIQTWWTLRNEIPKTKIVAAHDALIDYSESITKDTTLYTEDSWIRVIPATSQKSTTRGAITVLHLPSNTIHLWSVTKPRICHMTHEKLITPEDPSVSISTKWNSMRSATQIPSLSMEDIWQRIQKATSAITPEQQQRWLNHLEPMLNMYYQQYIQHEKEYEYTSNAYQYAVDKKTLKYSICKEHTIYLLKLMVLCNPGYVQFLEFEKTIGNKNIDADPSDYQTWKTEWPLWLEQKNIHQSFQHIKLEDYDVFGQ